ncbi:hypothetical protein CPB83DRAFT_905764 [Crepidotus variabilis]|uniref:Uncharacterized protein n=1 Tax=Crepidotus variabilis TaxID=179855 RepID=A0A9P6JQQ9_9AGAR|nr:hypothetical protein CPB83DRAFT_905764 [Crepidotus variabilis]
MSTVAPIELWYTKYWTEASTIFYPDNGSTSQKTIASPEEIANGLAPILVRYSDWQSAEALAKYVAHLSQNNPHDIEFLGRALSILQSTTPVASLKIKKPNAWPGFSKKKLFKDIFSEFLTEVIDDGLDDAYAVDEDTDAHDTIPESVGDTGIEADNIRLTTALLSASAVKYGLQDGSDNAFAAIRVGLKDPIGRTMEVYVVVALLHLAVCGDRLTKECEELFGVGRDGEADGVVKVLNEVKKNEFVKTPGVANLLERTIQIAESKFSRIHLLSEGEAWEILFLA